MLDIPQMDEGISGTLSFRGAHHTTEKGLSSAKLFSSLACFSGSLFPCSRVSFVAARSRCHTHPTISTLWYAHLEIFNEPDYFFIFQMHD
jgi:hypothetical protein